MNSETSFGSMKKFVVLVLLILSFLFIHGSPKVLIDYPFRYCSNTTLSPNSTYFSNLKILSTALSSNASRKLYHKYSVGRPPNPTAYGDFQCRGDLNATACRKCVATAASNCPLSVGAVVWMDECFFRYSNQSFFSVVVEQPSLILVSGYDIEKDVLGFDQIVGSTLNDTVANASSSVRFATKEASFRNKRVYTLAQCTADLSISNCGKCLRDALQNFPDCCSAKQGGRILFSSCMIGYELYAFYRRVSLSPSSISSPPASAPAPAVPPPPETPSLPAAPSLPSSPPALTLPSTTAPPLLSGKWRATVAMVNGIVVAAYFL